MQRKAISTLCLTVALVLTAVVSLRGAAERETQSRGQFYAADDKNIQYMGRVDFSNPKAPRFWAPGVTVAARFTGTYCDIDLNDEVLWGTSHNYIEIALDHRKPFRIQTTGKTNLIHVTDSLPAGEHTISVCKDTEGGIGYLEFVGIRCEKLLPPAPLPSRKLEFIGDSITCGTGSDQSDKPCGEGQWYDQHNAWTAYGPATARALNAQWHLTSVSGIGLIHSCCDMAVTMPDVFDDVDLREYKQPYDFSRYQPDAVTICLGQNDGEQDPDKFDAAYAAFIKRLRGDYPAAQIICLNSPMADAQLVAYQKQRLTAVVQRVNSDGDPNVHAFFFSQSWNGGCGGHPTAAQHQIIASELAAYLKSTLNWS